MPKRVDDEGILKGTKDIIADALGLKSVQMLNQKSSCRNISRPPDERIWGEDLVQTIYEQITQNGAGPTKSKKNWQLRQQTSIDDTNDSKETLLERAIVVSCKQGWLRGWYNQIPVASGLIDHRKGKRAAIDLVRKLDDRTFELIELKWEANNPVYAAFEILGYGLVYLFSRSNAAALGYERYKPQLLDARSVSLSVLAPTPFFSEFSLDWLELALSHGIAALAQRLTDSELSMTVRFYCFPDGFKLPYSKGSDVKALLNVSADHPKAKELIAALDGVRPVRFESSG